MTILDRSNFQAHPFHLVSPSPWPLYTSISLLSLTTSSASTFHGFEYGGYFLIASLLTLVSSMAFWFRDIISEGKQKNSSYFNLFDFFLLKIVKAISKEEIKQTLNDRDIIYKSIPKEQLGYYLAGLLEGDGSISIPALGNTTLNRILNPRLIFTAHKNNLYLYAYIQHLLGGIGRFQLSSNNNIRYIIGDIEGIKLIINLIHNKLRTPKNITFNKLIEFMNFKYNLSIEKSMLDESNLLNNSWFTGFVEADGNFYIKVVELKPKSDTRIRSISESISLKFTLNQSFYYKPTNSSNLSVMQSIAESFMFNMSEFETLSGKTLCVSATSINNIKLIVKYFNNYNLLGLKYKDFLDWEKVYYMILDKKHLSLEGINKIKLIKSGMNSKRII
jgi:hypothetical protein